MDVPRKGKRLMAQKAFADPTRIRTHAPRITIERYRDFTKAAVEKLRGRVETGDGYAVLTVIVACLRAGAHPPLWATEAFLQRYDTWDRTFQKRTLDDAFDVSARHTNKHLEVQRRNARLRPFIVWRVLQLSAAEVKPVAEDKPSRAVFAKVAEELRNHPDGDGSIKGNVVESIFYERGRTVDGIYQESASKAWKRFFKALERMPKAPPKPRPEKIA